MTNDSYAVTMAKSKLERAITRQRRQETDALAARMDPEIASLRKALDVAIQDSVGRVPRHREPPMGFVTEAELLLREFSSEAVHTIG